MCPVGAKETTSSVRHRTTLRLWVAGPARHQEGTGPATAAASVCMAEIDGNLSLQTSRLAVNIGA
jgi:hypothetical protein